MDTRPSPWKTIPVWGLILVAVWMVGAVIDYAGVSGTCMFILMPYFAAIATTYPVLALNRFGTGVWVHIPYMVIGFAPLYLFDWLQDGSLVGLWAVFVWCLAGPVIGLAMDLANRLAAKASERTRAIAVGAAMQLATFFIMLVGLTYLYKPTSAMGSHVNFLSKGWPFSLPWLVINGAFGGYTAYALKRRA